MKVGVIGGGVVGRATARCYLEFVDAVRVWDVLPERRTTESVLHALASDIVFVCLPTPQHAMGGGLDVTAVEAFFATLAGNNLSRNFVLKSTVPVGTTRRLAETYKLSNLVHSPEFLTARCAEVDAGLPALNVIGLPAYPQSNPCGAKLLTLYRKRFPGVEPFVCSSDESEALKLAVNSFAAVKVAFFNELHAFTMVRGLRWDLLRRMMLADGRIEPFWTRVPGPDGELGFGGTCLPKDLADLINCIESCKQAATMCRAAQERNRRDRGGNRGAEG